MKMITKIVYARFTAVAVVCVALAAVTQAVVPPPDGGYPNFTTAEGRNALKNLTSGSANTAAGLVFALERHDRQLQHRCWRRDACAQQRRIQIRPLALQRFC